MLGQSLLLLVIVSVSGHAIQSRNLMERRDQSDAAPLRLWPRLAEAEAEAEADAYAYAKADPLPAKITALRWKGNGKSLPKGEKPPKECFIPQNTPYEKAEEWKPRESRARTHVSLDGSR